MTGRYILDYDSEFMNIIKNINNTKYDCVIKYSSYLSPVNYKTKDCITGLIGMTCEYIKKINPVPTNDCIEWHWAMATYLMPDENIYKVNKLGISICPDRIEKYFKV